MKLSMKLLKSGINVVLGVNSLETEIKFFLSLKKKIPILKEGKEKSLFGEYFRTLCFLKKCGCSYKLLDTCTVGSIAPRFHSVPVFHPKVI